MIQQIHQRLSAWIERVVEGVPMSFAPPPEALSGEEQVCLYLLELGPAPAARSMARPPLRVQLNHLVTVQAPKPERAHELLDQLVFGALEEPGFEVELTPVSASVWSALGARPRPAFRLKTVAEKARPVEMQRVKGPLVAQTVPARPLVGRVVGPGDLPVVDAAVELSSLGLFTRTDAKGRFRFAAVPADTPLGRMEIRAKGAVLVLAVDQLETEEGLFRIQLPLS